MRACTVILSLSLSHLKPRYLLRSVIDKHEHSPILTTLWRFNSLLWKIHENDGFHGPWIDDSRWFYLSLLSVGRRSKWPGTQWGDGGDFRDPKIPGYECENPWHSWIPTFMKIGFHWISLDLMGEINPWSENGISLNLTGSSGIQRASSMVIFAQETLQKVLKVAVLGPQRLSRVHFGDTSCG